MAAEKVAATRKRLAREIAKDLRAGIAPLFTPGESTGKLVPFTIEPSRATAMAIASVIREANDRAVEQLGATLWDRAVAIALIEPFLTDHPHLMMYEPAKQVELGHAVFRVCAAPGPVNVPALIDALLHAEKMITLAVSGTRYAPDDNAKAAWALALEHADRSDHFRAASGENATKHLIALQTAPPIVMAQTRHGQLVVGRPQDSNSPH
ncbi:MAG: hypothetical protein ABI627_16880 [Polyangiaceae bacterium]